MRRLARGARSRSSRLWQELTDRTDANSVHIYSFDRVLVLRIVWWTRLGEHYDGSQLFLDRDVRSRLDDHYEWRQWFRKRQCERQPDSKREYH